ncbi:helicase-related protein [Streptomonospora wellingtoniae]|uniref:Helicase-related protein n=1 Tax=Streptomonospora wellingtoniae TaxID=3075544 RepID=A0ABU2KMX8_9ACTN|nr:helicase-related protein [Streptomonospora sp. DSM 45055]MDT0300609.1 helicase-related protein [Streptomonospora sp. DSM 45055]
MRLEDLKAGIRIEGIVPGEAVAVIAVAWHGMDAVELTYKRLDGSLAQQVLYRSEEPPLALASSGGRPYDADADEFKLVAEAQRIKLAGLFDPMLAVATSDVQPLPHQIRAVYGELLPRIPLRFLLADDPGAGKTIMAGLYIKELLLRGDVQRCLVVAPGGLVEQWQDELFFKFGLRFDILTPQLVEANIGSSVFEHHPLLITRMDQLARNVDLLDQIGESEWDLVIIDEAHRMGAHYFGGKLEKTKRFHLGELLGERTRHLLLMTATPHSGKEEDFQLFLTLLDRDRFAGRFRQGVHTADTSGVMRRMVKEDLLTFEGKQLFPERVAETVPYELTELENDLYEQVTAYVREGMNRAEKLDGKRRNTVGFALTVLQRRLASSPEAIYRSLGRRADRLEQRKNDLLAGHYTAEQEPQADVDTLDDPDERNAEEVEQLEDELLDSATAARTARELERELVELEELIMVAKRVRDSNTDRKWSELRTILEDNALTRDADGNPRKLIVFTEHRDTLEYLTTRIRTLLGKPAAVQAIHGGVRRAERRHITEEFTKNTDCQVLLATDAAGEGLNLQAAHLMVNYDLPWNPNRIEQRFGRIHRIGQHEVCRLWNLVASNTREGAVFVRLLNKVEEQRKAYGGKVFDVLGTAFEETPLRELLVEAIRYGEQPDVRTKMNRIIDDRVAEGLQELLAERALAQDSLAEADLKKLRRQMDEARARRLQPHYIEWAFRNAFSRLGGRPAKREKGRFEISNVPAAVRNAARWSPVATRYERVAFDMDHIDVEGRPRADLLAPGHPLHDAVADQTIEQLAPVLDRGTVLVSAAVDEPKLLVGVVEEVADATGGSVARRFGYAFVDENGTVSPAGPAPYLDCISAPESAAVHEARALPWLGEAEAKATSWIVARQLPAYLEEVRPRRQMEIQRVREQVTQRLNQEINRLAGEAMEAASKEAAEEKTKESSESLGRKAVDLEDRLARRRAELDRQEQMSTKPPRVVTSALVVPLSMVEEDIPAEAPIHAVETKDVERRGVDLVLKQERRLGREPVEQAFSNPGFDVLSERPDDDPIRIEVKARLAGADDFFVTHNEVITGKNAVPRYRLALVRVDPRGAEYDEVRYLDDPFRAVELGRLDVTGVRCDWEKTWSKGRSPF